MPVALIHTSVAALIAPGADRLGDLGLDQLLEHQTHRAAHQLRAATGAKRLPQLCCVSIRKGHRCVLLDELMISLTEDHADGPPSGGPLRLPQTPPLGGTLPRFASVEQGSDAVVVEVGESEGGAFDAFDEVVGCYL